MRRSVYTRRSFERKASVVDRLGIVRAYEMATGGNASTRGSDTARRVRVRCPIVGHLDGNPSCDLAPDKRTWYCHTCARGGALLDLPIVAGHVRTRPEAAAWYEARL